MSKYYLKKGSLVIGVSRSKPPINNSKYCHCTTDVTLEACIADLEIFLETLAIERIDILINNAGTGSYGNHISDSNPQEVLDQLNLHCVGALRITKAAQVYIENSKIVNVTSRLGSIHQNERGDFVGQEVSYSYRIAKCAQNMLSLCMSNDPELANATVISVNPGLLRTDSGSEDADRSAEEGAMELANLIGAADASGIYHAFRGEACY